jgi:uncharacterized protein DUF4129
MDRRRGLLVLSIVIIVAVAVLAASLHDVHFAPGKTIAIEAPSAAMPPLAISQTVSEMPVWKLLLFWLLFVVNLVFFFLLLPPELRKRILRQMISLALSALGILLALRYRLIQLPQIEGQPAEQADQGVAGPAGTNGIPGFQPPPMTAWWIYLVSFVVLAIVLTLVWVAYRWWIRQGSRTGSELDAIGAIAQSSLHDIVSGRNWADVIIQSYARMSEAVGARRGLQRAAAVTPREFAQRLEQAGLPAHAVQRLTRLFESARYGARASTQAEINEAVACLNSILQACGQTP